MLIFVQVWSSIFLEILISGLCSCLNITKTNVNFIPNHCKCQKRKIFLLFIEPFFKNCICGVHLQYYFHRRPKTASNMKNRKVIRDKTNICLSNELTHKKLEFLLPSSKQIMLINSSIRYNTGLTQNGEPTSNHNLETPASQFNEPEEDKENDGAFLRTPLNGALQKQEYAFKERSLVTGLATPNDQDIKISAQSYSNITYTAAQYIKTPVSAGYLPFLEQANCKNLTSLNNIMTHDVELKKLKQDSTSKEELIKRISRLQNLVEDIISGKITVPKASQSQRIVKVKKENKTSIKVLQQKMKRNNNRSVTWNKQVNKNSSKSLKSAKSKPKLKLESSEERNETSSGKTSIINPKCFVIKKKNQLKITSNYQPIRQQCEQKTEAKNIPKYINPLAERSSQCSLYPKMRAKVIFVPSYINL